MKKLSALLLTFTFIGIASAQSNSIKGTVVDTLNKQNLSNSTVTLLRAKDSVLVKFTRTDKDGKFELKNLPAGNHVLMIKYPAFADYFDAINIKEPSTDIGNIRLTLKSKLLEDVMVRTKIAAIRLKGDT